MAATKNATSVFSNALTGNVVSASVARGTGEGLLCAVWQECDFTAAGSAGAPVWDSAGDNQTFTSVASLQEWGAGSGVNRKLSLFVLPAPTTAKTGAVESTLTGGYGGANTHDRASMLVVRISGHDAADMIRASNATHIVAPETDDLPNTVTSAVGDLVVFFGSAREITSEFEPGDTSGYEEFSTAISSRSLFLGTKAGAASATTGTFTYINSTGQSNALIAVSIKAGAAPSDLTGGFTLTDLVFGGTFATGALSQLAGGITLDDFLNGGVMGLAPGIVVTEPFKNWGGTLLPGTTVPNVVFLKLDRTTAVALVNQTTAGDGVMTVANAALVAGTFYIMVSFDATGASIGAELVQAT